MASTPTTATTTAITARGKVTAFKEGLVTFVPYNTAYALHLAAPGYGGPLDTLVNAIIRVTARKAYTVPSGGNFISPIYGPPKTIQGRVRAVEGAGVGARDERDRLLPHGVAGALHGRADPDGRGAHSRSNPLNRSQSVTAASFASISTCARFR